MPSDMPSMYNTYCKEHCQCLHSWYYVYKEAVSSEALYIAGKT